MYSDNPCSFLNSDTELYNLLLDAKKGGHPLLKHFKILYPEKLLANPVNAIYVGRTETRFDESRRTFDSVGWIVQVQIFILTKKYDVLERRQLIKSVIYAIRELLAHSSMSDRVRINNIHFRYNDNNVLHRGELSLQILEESVDYYEKEYVNVCNVLADIDKEPEKRDINKTKEQKERDI